MKISKSRLVSVTRENRGKGASHIAVEPYGTSKDRQGRLILKAMLFRASEHYLGPHHKGRSTINIDRSRIPLNWVRIPDKEAQDFLNEQDAIISAAYLRKAEYLQEHFREWSLAEVSDFPPKEHKEAEEADDKYRKSMFAGDFKRMFK